MRTRIITWPLLVATSLAMSTSAQAGDLKPLGTLKPLGNAPAFKLRSIDGALIQLNEIAYPGREKSWAKKQPVLLDFFRTDCSPCRRAMPDLIALHDSYTKRGLKVILVALLEEESGRAKLDRYLAKNKLPFTILIDANEHYSKKYLGKQIQLPSSFLINKNGKIIQEKRGAKGNMKAYFGAQIENLLAQ